MVFFAAPVMRTVARMLFPSTRQPMIWARFSVVSRFILTIMLEGSDGKTLPSPIHATICIRTKGMLMPEPSKADLDHDMTDEEIREIFSTLKLPDVPVVPLRPTQQQQPLLFFRITGDSRPLNRLR